MSAGQTSFKPIRFQASTDVFFVVGDKTWKGNGGFETIPDNTRRLRFNCFAHATRCGYEVPPYFQGLAPLVKMAVNALNSSLAATLTPHLSIPMLRVMPRPPERQGTITREMREAVRLRAEELVRRYGLSRPADDGMSLSNPEGITLGDWTLRFDPETGSDPAKAVYAFLYIGQGSPLMATEMFFEFCGYILSDPWVRENDDRYYLSDIALRPRSAWKGIGLAPREPELLPEVGAAAPVPASAVASASAAQVVPAAPSTLPAPVSPCFDLGLLLLLMHEINAQFARVPEDVLDTHPAGRLLRAFRSFQPLLVEDLVRSGVTPGAELVLAKAFAAERERLEKLAASLESDRAQVAANFEALFANRVAELEAQSAKIEADRTEAEAMIEAALEEESCMEEQRKELERERAALQSLQASLDAALAKVGRTALTAGGSDLAAVLQQVQGAQRQAGANRQAAKRASQPMQLGTANSIMISLKKIETGRKGQDVDKARVFLRRYCERFACNEVQLKQMAQAAFNEKP